MRDLESRFGSTLSMDSMLATVPAGVLTQANYDRFRRLIRERTIAYVRQLPVENQFETLHELIDILPDNGSRGELFTAYRRSVMGDAVDDSELPMFGTFGERPDPFVVDVPGQPTRRRTPDDYMEVIGTRENFVPPGRYAVEDKTGRNAFILEQAQDYARMHAPDLVHPTDPNIVGGFRRTESQTTSDYDGLVYNCSNLDEARRAFDEMQEDALTSPLLDRPQGIYVTYLNTDGTWIRYTGAVP